MGRFLRPLRTFSVLVFSVLPLSVHARAQSSTDLDYDTVETAGIDGRNFSGVFLSAKTVDAVHRAVLIRFPGAPEAIKTRLDAGLRIKSAAIEFTYSGYELHPAGYVVRDGLGKKKWAQDPPRWHLIAYPLRKPWIADARFGPTFTYAINGLIPWAKLGAGSKTTDRFPMKFGPVELSQASPRAQLDITSFLATDAAASLGERLRLLEQSGFLLQKLEEYDSKYRDLSDAYEWSVPTGGHGLSFSQARLVLTFEPTSKGGDSSTQVALPPPVSFATVVAAGEAASQSATPPGEISLETLKREATALVTKKPGWMADWQFKRAQEMLHVGGDSSKWLLDLTHGDSNGYRAYLNEVWRTPPRYWKGWGIEDDLILTSKLNAFVPEHIKDHLARYWASWLMPDIPTRELFHPQSKEADDYAKKSGDWRGRASFFRDGYNYVGSTQNFNHTASVGALLGGRFINSQAAMADGRNGLEKLLLRYWAFNDGSSQEVLDHYYLSITLSSQKMLADFGPTPFDRLAGRIMLERTMEMLATLYHPRLHRFVGPSGRARLSGVLVEQDGIYGAMHALSKKGVLNYLDQPFNAKAQGMPVWGYDFPPGRVGLQSLSGPWAPTWFSKIIDDKSFPFEETSAETIRGYFNPPLWRRAYLGNYYGLASQNIKGGSVDVLAQWLRSKHPAATIADAGTLTARYCIYGCDMVTTHGGAMPVTGSLVTFQDKNRAIIFTTPLTDRAALERAGGSKGLKSLGTAICLWNFQPSRTWQLYVDGVQKLESDLPLHLKMAQTLTLQDGPSYVGIRALPATDLGRGGEELVVALGGYGGNSEASVAPIEPALTITAYNLKSEMPLHYSGLDWDKIEGQTYGGFAIELSDVTEFKDIAAFNEHFAKSVVTTTPKMADHTVDVSFQSGAELMSATFATDIPQMNVHFPIPPGTQGRALQNPLVNGAFPYLKPGLERETSWSEQGTSGRLEKNGVVLETDPGRKSYLIADRQARGILAYNPLPDSTPWHLSLPGGASIKAEGKVGLLRVAIDRVANTIEIDHAVRHTKQAEGLAKTVLLEGFPERPQILVNGQLAVTRMASGPEAGKAAISIEVPALAAE